MMPLQCVIAVTTIVFVYLLQSAHALTLGPDNLPLGSQARSSTQDYSSSAVHDRTDPKMLFRRHVPNDSALYDVYSIDTDSDESLDDDLELTSETLSSNDDGTVSSANSNRTPDFTLEASSQVQVQLYCIIDRAFCEKVADALREAAAELSKVVNVKNDLIIQASYYSFCDNGCANDTVGWGAPSSQFTLPFEDGADLNYIYPQALAKQLAPYSNTSAWASHDIAIEINHDAYMSIVDWDNAYASGWNGTGVPPGGRYYFKTDASIGPEQIDLRYIILHEILHGLGFISSWAGYFANKASPFRSLIEGIIDPDELNVVTPSPYWYIKQQSGPIFVTGFQPTMIFDKFLYAANPHTNSSVPRSLASTGFDIQNFCVQDNQAFVINFVREFNRSKQSRTAADIWASMSLKGSLTFRFPPSSLYESAYNHDSFLNKTYKEMVLLTGDQALTSQVELSDRNFRLGISISHVDNRYVSTPDFLMTGSYIKGEVLENLVDDVYSNIPAIHYNTTYNATQVSQVYKSPIGPGILRVLDSMGYSTILSNTNYTTTGSVNTGKMTSVCDDKNSNHGIANKASELSVSAAKTNMPATNGQIIVGALMATIAFLT